jgi:hypothetical protein
MAGADERYLAVLPCADLTVVRILPEAVRQLTGYSAPAPSVPRADMQGSCLAQSYSFAVQSRLSAILAY